ncbi:glycosyltransferase family 87 protein [Streptomyces sp. C]|uniref:glycosyltransferase family 87 protein n=1 Tax=Streptomyces sp. C TaxID=253839 RepID=UPI0001B55791|nr:glycosyltransferase family 87 protein [Streptomyces sp. C]EFL15538.1 integral membrane protein [Streptomyces sp. C]
MTTTSSLPADPVAPATAAPASHRRRRTSSEAAARRRGALLGIAGFWLASRAAMLWMLVNDFFSSNLVRVEVTATYHNWYDVLSTWTLPQNDIMWQYPPAAAAVFLSPDLLPFLTYFQAFVALTVLCDGVVLLGLVRAARRSDGSMAGALLWLVALPMMMATPFARYDIQVTLLAVFALLALRSRPRAGGVVAGIGAMVKVWPLLTLLGTPRGRSTRDALVAAALSCAALLAVFAALFSDTFGFLGNQGDRGVQVESLGGSVLMAARFLDLWPGGIDFQYGAFEYIGPYVPDIARASLALTLAGFLLLLLWRVRANHWTSATPFDAALCAIMVFTVTSRVISPQYMIWLLGLAAVCLTSRNTTQRPVAWLLVAANALTTLIFPVWYADILATSALGTVLLCVRNGLLLYATVWSVVRLWKATVLRDRAPEAAAA